MTNSQSKKWYINHTNEHIQQALSGILSIYELDYDKAEFTTDYASNLRKIKKRYTCADHALHLALRYGWKVAAAQCSELADMRDAIMVNLKHIYSL